MGKEEEVYVFDKTMVQVLPYPRSPPYGKFVSWGNGEKPVPELGYWKPGSIWGCQTCLSITSEEAFFSHNLKNIYVLGKELYEGKELSLLASDEIGSPEQFAKQFPIAEGYASRRRASLGCDSCVETKKVAFLRWGILRGAAKRRTVHGKAGFLPYMGRWGA